MKMQRGKSNTEKSKRSEENKYFWAKRKEQGEEKRSNRSKRIKKNLA